MAVVVVGLSIWTKACDAFHMEEIEEGQVQYCSNV